MRWFNGSRKILSIFNVWNDLYSDGCSGELTPSQVSFHCSYRRKDYRNFSNGTLATVIGFPFPKGMGYRELFVAGVIAAMGLTVALFVSGVAFIDPSPQGAAKMGALFSVATAVIAFIAGKVLGIKKVSDTEN